jgi:ketosteroid isomerase-like protein
MVDLGIGHEQIADTTERVATTSIVAIVPPNAQSHEVERARLHSLEIELSAAATSSGFGRAIKPLVAEDARFNRHGLPPVIGRREVEQLLTQEGGRRGWEVTGWDVAGSRDLAYAWGSYQTVATDGIESEKGNYLRVWRRNPEGKWEVALEVMSGVR